MSEKASTTASKKKPRKNTLVKSISLPKRIIEMGERRARAARRSFSNHLMILIEQEAAAAK